MNAPVFSCIIPCSKRDLESQNLKDLIVSIRSQDFPQDQIEILLMGEEYGDSEQAKAAGIRKSTGQICAMFCADNELCDKRVFKTVKYVFDSSVYPDRPVGVYTKHYQYKKTDNSLNRYFSLIGCNDVIAFYLKKADRKPYWDHDSDELCCRLSFKEKVPSLGDNAFFFDGNSIRGLSLDHYYPMDAAEDLRKIKLYDYIRCNGYHVWHRTSDKLIPFLIKRYKYARDLYSDRKDRRWKIIDGRNDYIRLMLFVLATITCVEPIFLSIRGYLKIRDSAWFWHLPVCWGFLITYTILAIRNLFKHGRLFQCASLQPA